MMVMDEEDVTTWRIKAGYASWVFLHEIGINSKFKSKFVFGRLMHECGIQVDSWNLRIIN